MKKYLFILLLGLFAFSGTIEAQSTYSVSFYRTGKTYRVNDLVSQNGIIYKALISTTQQPPHVDWVNISSTAGSGAGNINDGTVVGRMTYWNGTSWVETAAATTDDTDLFVLNDLEVTGAISGSNLSGTNTGDQTSINGITGTKAQFDAAVTDGDILYVGDVTETDPVFAAEESDIVKINEAKTITSQQTFSSTGIPLVNALSSEIDAAGILAVPNSRWVLDQIDVGVGDMTKSVYDVGENNLVDNSDFAPYLTLTSTDTQAAIQELKDEVDGIDGTTAIGRYDEGNGDTFYPVGYDRTYTANGGAGALDLSFNNNAGPYQPLQGSIGSQSFTMGFNVKNEGYGAFMIGEDARIQSTGTYSISQGYGNDIAGYTSVGIGTYLTTTPNYTFTVGHTNQIDDGGGTIALGRGLLESSAAADAAVILGQSNLDPDDINGFSANNVGGMIGVGEMSGAGATPYVRTAPKNAMTWFRGADAGVVQLDTTTIALINSKKATFPKMIPTVEYVDDAVAGASVTKLSWADTDATGDYAWEVDGNPFIHNYTGNTTNAANPWYQNTFVGQDAGNYSVGNGQSTLGVGMINTGIGAWALNALTTGQQNVMIGNEAGALMTTSSYNVGIGDGVFYYSVNATVNNNMGIGKNVFQNLTDAEYNVGMGRNSGFFVGSGSTQMTSGDHHTLLGQDTRPSATRPQHQRQTQRAGFTGLLNHWLMPRQSCKKRAA